VGGRLELEDVLTKMGWLYGVEVFGSVVGLRAWLVVGSVCWRHTTMYDGTCVCWMLAADVNVRTLGGARCGAPVPWWVVFRKRWRTVRVRNTEVGTYFDFEVGDAEAVGWTEFEFRKAAPCCVYRMVPLRIL
jgi:hypothetical protein